MEFGNVRNDYDTCGVSLFEPKRKTLRKKIIIESTPMALFGINIRLSGLSQNKQYNTAEVDDRLN